MKRLHIKLVGLRGILFLSQLVLLVVGMTKKFINANTKDLNEFKPAMCVTVFKDKYYVLESSFCQTTVSVRQVFVNYFQTDNKKGAVSLRHV